MFVALPAALAQGGRPLVVTARPVTLSVAVPKLFQAGQHAILHLRSIQGGPARGAILRVFADLPDADVNTSVDSDHFVGHVTLLGGGGAQPRGASLDLAWLRRRGPGPPVKVTIVPMADYSAAPLRIEKIEIERAPSR